MKKLILGVVLCIASIAANAGSGELDVRGLTDIQKAEMAVQVAKLKAAPAVETPMAVAENVTKANDVAVDATKKWAGVGKELASGLVGAAKELGVAVNEFAVTPVGQLTTYIIVWKLLGKDLVGIFIASIAFFGVIPLIWYMFRRLAIQSIQYEDRKGLFGFNYRVRKTVQFDRGDGQVVAFVVGCFATLIMVWVGVKFLPF